LIDVGDEVSGSYTFTHVTPAIYLDTFGSGLSANDVIARESMSGMHDNMDPMSCGFSGKRPVSWATAKSLVGLAAVRGIFQDFPEREMPTGQVQGRQYLFLFLVAICGSATALAFDEKLTPLYAEIIGMVVLACLLVYGYISERSFIDVLLTQKRLRKKVASL
jgi:hypothetical protein